MLTTLSEHYNTDYKTQNYFDVQGAKSVLGVTLLCEPKKNISTAFLN